MKSIAAILILLIYFIVVYGFDVPPVVLSVALWVLFAFYGITLTKKYFENEVRVARKLIAMAAAGRGNE